MFLLSKRSIYVVLAKSAQLPK